MIRKSLCIGLLLILTLLSLGCIDSDIPIDEIIYLNPSSPTFEIPITSDYSEVSWYLDDSNNILREDTDIGHEASYLLNYEDLPAGKHIFGVKDNDEKMEWNIVVNHEPTEGTTIESEQTSNDQGGAKERGYNQNTPRDERHRLAQEYWDNL